MLKKILFILALTLFSSSANAQFQKTPNEVNGCQYLSAMLASANGQNVPFQCDANGNLKVTSGAASGTGGVTNFSRIVSSAATTNLTAAKAGAGRVYKIYGCNTGSTAVYIRFYNIASGSVTVGTSTVTMSREFPGNLCSSYDFSDIGMYFSTAITYAMTGANPDSDTTALTAGQMVQVEVAYQ